MAAKKEELFQPIFPALSMCLVIDARYSSRAEILRDIKASDLFETIAEAKSVDDGGHMIAYQDIDACLIGPSVSRATACGVVERLIAKTRSKDCAFIAIRSTGDTDEEELISAGCHKIIRIPCSKMKFCEGLVRGIIAANANSPWVGIMLEAEKNGVNPFAETKLIKLASGDDLSSSGLNAIFPQVAGQMQDVFSNVESGQYTLDKMGNLNDEAHEAIAALVKGMLESRDFGQRADTVKTFLEAAFREWFLDLKKLNQKQATSTLKKKLTAYFQAA